MYHMSITVWVGYTNLINETVNNVCKVKAILCHQIKKKTFLLSNLAFIATVLTSNELIYVTKLVVTGKLGSYFLEQDH